jgi:hypothetical protein
MLFLNPLNRIQVRGELLQPNFSLRVVIFATEETQTSAASNALSRTSIECRGVGLDLRLKAGRNYREAAQRMLDEFLEYLGDHLLVQLICHESVEQPEERGLAILPRLDNILSRT